MPTTRDRDAVTLLIDDQEFAFWSEIELTRSMDAFSTASFTAPFEPSGREFRETFRPFTFKPLRVLIGGELFFTGTLVDVAPANDANSSSVKVTAYSLPGVLVDCAMPASAMPIEYKGLDFGELLKSIAEPFGLGSAFATSTEADGTTTLIDVGAPFEKVALDVEDKPIQILIDLAKQRGLLLTNAADGKVLCWKANAAGNPVARLSGLPLTDVSASFSAQEYFSEITGFAPPKRKKEGSKYTGKNKWLPSPLRPMSFKLDDTEKGDAPSAVATRLGRMFANMASYTISDLPTWRTPAGELWEPNTTLMLLAPHVMVYQETKLMIREVGFRLNKEAKTATLNLVLPGAFSGEVPKELPWNESEESAPSALPDNGDPLPAFLGQP